MASQRLGPTVSMVVIVVVVAVVASSEYDGVVIKNNVVLLNPEQQSSLVARAGVACLDLMARPAAHVTGDQCARTWDTIACWPDTAANTVARQACPRYVNGFIVNKEATRTCLADGTWFFRAENNATWSNYTECISDRIPTLQTTNVSSLLARHLGSIEVMYRVGYGLSLVSLLIAVVIMIYFKRLHCPRNTVHVHLFVSFILRASICFLKDLIFVEGVGLHGDVTYDEFGQLTFTTGQSHWQCKLVMVIFNFLLATNYMWIFIEALYLHMLIFVSVFSENSSVRAYIIIGWTAPLTFVLPWALVRLFMEDELCWNTHPTEAYFWIIKAPIAVTVLMNFVFFINILRVLFTKMQAVHTSDARQFRYRKLAKSTLILIPLFGVHYIVFLGVPDRISDMADLVKLCFEMFFNSFQGFLVAVIFCFMNAEVQGELRKTWQRYRIRHGALPGGTRPSWATLTTTLQRKRNSVNSDQSFGDHPSGVRPASREASPKLAAIVDDAATETGDRCRVHGLVAQSAAELHQLLLPDPAHVNNGNCASVGD